MVRITTGAVDESRTRAARDRWRRLWPFLSVVGGAFSLAIIPPHPSGIGGLVLAAASFGVTAALIIGVPWHRLPIWTTQVAVMCFCTSVAFLRDATGAGAAGFASLVYLPVIWQALFAGRRELYLSVATVFVSLSTPIVVVGAPEYPVTLWRSTILITMVALGAGGVIQALVASVRRSQALIDAVASTGRRIGLDGAPMEDAICEAISAITGASKGFLVSELGDDRTGVAGGPVPDGDLIRSALVEPAREMLREGEAGFVADLGARPGWHGLQDALGVSALWFEPVVQGDRVIGALVAGWAQPLRRVPADLPVAMKVLASEASVAIERAALLDQVAQLARADELTGLPNRRAWDESLAQAGAVTARRGDVVSVALLDLDHFKRYNDTLGHSAGDELLRAAAAAWRSVLRPGDFLARWGGEEFALLLTGSDSDETGQVIDRLRAVTPDGQTFSAGISTSRRGPLDDHDLSWMVHAADVALYQAKDRGRDRTVVDLAAPGEPGTEQRARSARSRARS